MIYNYFFNKQIVRLEKKLFVFNRLINLYPNAFTKNWLLILTYIASFIRFVYPVLLLTTIFHTISFSSFSKDFSTKKSFFYLKQGRFEIQNFSVDSKHLTVALESIKETEQLLNNYSKTNHYVDVNILDKINITFFVDIQMKGAMGAFSAEGTTQKPTIYLNTDWLKTGISSNDVTKVLLEEYGHYLDSKFSSSDRVGDEGELFANIVLGKKISTSDLMRMMIENDHSTINDNGRVIEVEQATVYFNKIYKAGTAPSAGYDIQESSITNIQLVTGSGYRFISSNPSDALYTAANGNNVAGNLVYIDVNNVQQTIAGFISRQDKVGSNPVAFFFVPANFPTADAYLFVVPGYEAKYSTIAASSSPDVATASDFRPSSLNSVLSDQAALPILSVSSPTASETAGYMTFTISLSVANTAVTTFTPSLIAGTATAGSDYTSSMEYLSGSSWLSISSTLSIPTGTTSMQIRVPITNDATTESAETFTLKTGTISGGTILNSSGTFGTGTITDVVSTISSTGTLSSFSTCDGFASGSQTFTISGTDLTANISLAAPPGYEISLDGTTYSSPTLSISQVGGVVTSTTVYVRLKSTAMNGASGNISATSTGATTVNVATGTGVVNPIPSSPSGSGSNCVTGGTPVTVSMTASGCSGTVSWYGSLTGGSPLTTGNSYTTPSISTTTNYYIDCSQSGCVSSPRSQAVATITTCSSSIINSSGTLNPFTTCDGFASGSQTFTISGTGLTANISLAAPPDYEISIDGGANYFDTRTLIQVVGVVNSTTVYVRLKSTAMNGASGNISATSTGATTVNVATGTGVVNAIPSSPTGSGSNCVTGGTPVTVSMTASGCVGGIISWYDALTRGSALGKGTSFTTPSISTTTNYYIECSLNSCVSSPRSQAVATITACSSSTPPTISSISPQTINSNSATTALAFTISDAQTAASSLILNVNSSDINLMPLSGIVLAGSNGNRTIRLTPVLGRSGNSTITITVTDSDNLTASTNFILTVNSQPPTIGVLPDQTINVNSSTPSRSFVVRNDVATLSVVGSSSNLTLVPTASIFFTGTGTNRSIVITPTAGLVGNSVITVEVNYADGSSEYISFNLTVVNANTVPYLSPLKNVNLCLNTIGTLPFVIGDNETPTEDLILSINSSNNSIISRSEIQVTGTGQNKILTLSPASKQFGTSLITISVFDNVGAYSTQTFTFTLNPCDSDNDGIPNEIECPVYANCPDTDGDGTPNYLDTDSDNDGILDNLEKNIDSDGDSIPDYLDIDSDNDGIPDSNEGYIDSDGDGIMNYLDLDSDGDGIEDRVESYIDSDRDGIPNFLDLDSDGDGIYDKVEGLVDTDKDGFPNYIDGDSDNDGIPDGMEGRASAGVPVDSDGDGKPDYIDLNSDNDGIPDKIEKNTIIISEGKVINQPLDTDGDGKPDYLDLDSDNDGIPDSVEAGPNPNEPIDSDSDGQPDYLDLDSDNDGIPDKIEAGKNPNIPVDTDGDGKPDYLDLDSDNDGIPDKIEAGKNPNIPVDTDGDGKPDYLDLDSDNDGIPDKVEAGKNPNIPVDTDGDGKPDYLDVDSDNDGIPDKVEAGTNPNIPVDTDGDGKPDYLDLDSDNDSIPDKVEAGTNPNVPVDTDGDGKTDYLDLDSDNDSIPDKVEAGTNPNVPVDSDGDGKPDYLDLDSDNDSIPDKVEAGTNPNVPVDSDGDGKPDYLDLDSDNDSIPDKVEAGINPNLPVDSDGDGKPDYIDLDSDNDSIPDKVEAGINPNIPVDSHGDGKPDYLDIDSDNDSIPDKVEAGSNPNIPVDTDKDGKQDYLDLDSDNDGIPDKVEAGNKPNTPVDTDSDGNADYIDLDSDNDSIPDKVEAGINPIIPADTDRDGNPDYLDLDSDNDGIPDKVESGINPNVPVDTDGDGIMDFRDTDSDNDGILDKLEDDLDYGNLPDCDKDNIPNYIDADQCETFTPEGISPNGDGRNDVLIIPGIKAKNNNRIAIYNRWGNLVYEKENYQNDWGGEANVKNIVLETDGLLPDGTYYYVVLFDKKQATKAGFIYISRLNN